MEERKPAEVRWYVTKSQYSPLSYREKLTSAGLEFFLPTRFVIQDIGGRRMRMERPVIFNFVFVRGTIFQVKDFCIKNQGLHLVYRHRHIDEKENTEEKMVMTVSDKEMNMFARTIGEYTQDVPFVKPTEVDLEKGDYVRILEGPFAGVEGVLMSQQGKDGGRVLVSLSKVIAVPTLEIEPQYLQILSFAPKGKHLYKKFDSFMAKARKALRNYHSGKLEKKDVVALNNFESRFSCLETQTINSRLKLLVYMLVCHTCLNEWEKQAEVEKNIVDILGNVNSDTFRVMAYVYLFGCTKKVLYTSEAEKIIAQWGVIGEKEKTKREIAEDFAFFKEV